MIYFLLGIIVGILLLTSCLTLVYIMLRNNLSKAKQVVNKLQTLGSKKAILINNDDEEIKSWVDNLPSG